LGRYRGREALATARLLNLHRFGRFLGCLRPFNRLRVLSNGRGLCGGGDLGDLLLALLGFWFWQEESILGLLAAFFPRLGSEAAPEDQHSAYYQGKQRQY